MREALFLLVFVLATPSCLEGSAWAPPGCAPPHPLSPPCRAAGMVKTTTTIPPEEHQALRLAEQVKQARHESRAYSKALVRENNQTFHWDWAIPEGGYVQEVPLRAESALAFEFAVRALPYLQIRTEANDAGCVKWGICQVGREQHHVLCGGTTQWAGVGGPTRSQHTVREVRG